MRRPQETPVRGWERWVNPRDFGLGGGMEDVWKAYGFRTYARVGSGALTFGGESGFLNQFLCGAYDCISFRMFRAVVCA